MHPQLKEDGVSGSVKQFINLYFQGNPSLYYRCVRDSAVLLSKEKPDEESKELIAKLKKDTTETSRKIAQMRAEREIRKKDSSSTLEEDIQTEEIEQEFSEEDFPVSDGSNDWNGEEVTF